MQRSAKGLLIVESDVPYSTAIVAWLRLRGLPLEAIEHPSRGYERAFLAWETVRRVRNPFFREGTGFEGYFIGQCSDADDMTHRLLALGQAMIDSNRRFYSPDSPLLPRLDAALTTDAADVEALLAWSSLLGAMLGRLRAAALRVPDAAIYQSDTYRMTNALPQISYTLAGGRIRQTYTLPYPSQSSQRKIAVDARLLPAPDRAAARVIWSVGKLGHPLVRQYLANIARP